jgi:hypothetical protein
MTNLTNLDKIINDIKDKEGFVDIDVALMKYPPGKTSNMIMDAIFKKIITDKIPYKMLIIGVPEINLKMK